MCRPTASSSDRGSFTARTSLDKRMVFFLSPSHCLVAFLLLVVSLLVGPVLSQSAIMGADPPYVHQDVHLGLPEHDHRNRWWVVFSQWNSARQRQVNTPVQPFWADESSS
ncbi:hypothetical protein F5880DRAFT_1511856 [Lentinula raphanica]|nr:hypothetical protein F5880DRAFT_1511856 [Lentinula raphanica]